MDFKLDATGDLDITNNSFSLVEGAAAVKQHCQVRLKFFLGEWFLDTRIGVPWFQQILVKGVSTTMVQQIIRDVILGTPGVKSIDAFSMVLNDATRELAVEVSGKLDADVGEDSYEWSFDELILPRYEEVEAAP